MSDWLANHLTQEQLWYAAGDVVDLHELHTFLRDELRVGQHKVYYDALAAIKIKARLEVEGYTNLLDYPQTPVEEVLANRNWWKRLVAKNGDDNE